jgi:4-O-beta-D-mannosyl-D-glucose phosphorylase
MNSQEYQNRYERLIAESQALITRPNPIDLSWNNGVFERYTFPVITAAHVPLSWRYDFNPKTNPYLMERLGVNAAFNPGAIEFNNRICLVVRVEGYDRKSFFAIAESENGIEHFKFWDEPLVMPETDQPDINVYDMRLVKHEDGWIYGLFCSERKDPSAPSYDTSSATAQGGIARTKDLVHWERLPDLKTPSPQQRNVVLHPEFIHGQYGFYTRPMDEFIKTGSGGGIGWGLSASMNPAIIEDEQIIDPKIYHSIKEVKNGEGPAPIKTGQGWLHLAHGVRNTAAGLRYVLYLYLSNLDEPWKVTHRPAGYFLAPVGDERIGDVSNVTFSNAWINKPDGRVLIYYASSDTRCHVVTSSVDRLVDYCIHTPEDGLRSAASVQQRNDLIHQNKQYLPK